MSINYIIVPIETSKTIILERIKKHIELGKKEPTILIVNSERKLLGELRISNLLFEKKEKEIYTNIKKLPSIRYDEDQTEVISRFKEHRHEKIIVLDEKETVMGLIHARDIFKLIEDENTENFYAISGLQKEEDITDSAFDKVKYRFSWLLINLLTAFLAAFVVSRFEETISKIVILAAFMPIVAGMGGNAGTQTVAILVRSLALKKIDSSLGKKILLNEILASSVNGLLIGLLVGLIAYIYGESILFGLVAGIATLLNLVIAALFGTIIPLILKTFGIDPASSSSVFVTTTTDVFGFLILLGLASIILI
jgi:magnesium transporter